ncbi:MAG: hypothetical protein IPL10_12360 [Bacteroidetes bacterium]|nr:hypothetical protein [Bacteroidota bacterium]
MKFRIFYAPEVFRTWEKVLILTSDGKLYCEYLFKFELNKIEKTGLNYETFAPKDFNWGKGVEGNRGIAFSNYQDCEQELTWDEYSNLRPGQLLSGYKPNDINRHLRWVSRYLKTIGLSPSDWDKEMYNKFIVN